MTVGELFTHSIYLPHFPVTLFVCGALVLLVGWVVNA